MNNFLQKIKTTPDNISFDETISIIDTHYNFSPCQFKNGDINNDKDQNNGSCKIFTFAHLHNFTEQQTLHCFGDYYRLDVLQNPEKTDHQNIRNFMLSGWQGITFSETALREK